MKRKSLLLSLIIMLLISLAATGTALGEDVYSSFRALAAKQKENVDYRISSYNGSQSTLVMAVHGGGIEIGTSELASNISKQTGCDFYAFEGIKDGSNWCLHITSTRFNEPLACKLVSKSDQTLSLHGCRGDKAITYLGGLDTKLGRTIKQHLEDAGFTVYKAPAHLDGKNPNNICNENKIGKGVQLELTRELRERFFDDDGLSKTFYRYSGALSAALMDK